MLTHGIPPAFRDGVIVHLFYTVNRHAPSGQSRLLSGHAIAYRWRSLPRARRHRASSPQGSSSNGCCLFRYHHRAIYVRLSFHTHYWYEVDMCDTNIIGDESLNVLYLHTYYWVCSGRVRYRHHRRRVFESVIVLQQVSGRCTNIQRRVPNPGS